MAKTAYLYDDIYLEHDTGWNHVECPARLRAIDKKIKAAPYYNDLLLVRPELPDIKYIEMIHSPGYIKEVEEDITRGVPCLDAGDTMVGPASFNVALMAVGGCLKVCDAVMEKKAQCGFCAVRPPGHHAERDYAAGFCIFNNIAISARYVQAAYGIQRVAIVDWDVHHGNGTQHAFELDDSVLYISVHLHPHYPGTGSPMERGRGKGEGYTINLPMKQLSTDKDYLDVFTGKIAPALDSFKPQVIFISAGFDAHRADPLSSTRLSTETYGMFTQIIMDAAKRHSENRVIATLEGGYNIEALSASVEKVISTFVRA